MKYDLTYEDAQEICKYWDNFHFSEYKYMIDGYKISTFSYFICNYDHFENPLPFKPVINAFDMRGVTFVFNLDGTVWKKFLMLPKFFNLNQVDATQYDKLKDKTISNITVKEDGSLVTFMLLPNGKIFSKTIAGFSNDQCEAALELLNKNNILLEWVRLKLNEGFTPLFEYVSFSNRIVIEYGSSELRFIGMRSNIDGTFIPANEVEIPTKKVETISSTLDDLIARSKIEQNIEGWVVMFDDGTLIKIKTEWYFNIHWLRTETAIREDYIIKNYYDETLDDILAQLDKDNDKDLIEFIDYVINGLTNFSKHIDGYVFKHRETLLNECNNDWKTFASNNFKEPYFALVKYFDFEEYKNAKIKYILKQTYRLKDAREIIKKFSK